MDPDSEEENWVERNVVFVKSVKTKVRLMEEVLTKNNFKPQGAVEVLSLNELQNIF